MSSFSPGTRLVLFGSVVVIVAFLTGAISAPFFAVIQAAH
jgi:hypothetical protein